VGLTRALAKQTDCVTSECARYSTPIVLNRISVLNHIHNVRWMTSFLSSAVLNHIIYYLCSLCIYLACWNIVSSSKIDENAVKDIVLSSSKWLGRRPRKRGDVGSSSTGSDIFRVFSSIFKFVKNLCTCSTESIDFIFHNL